MSVEELPFGDFKYVIALYGMSPVVSASVFTGLMRKDFRCFVARNGNTIVAAIFVYSRIKSIKTCSYKQADECYSDQVRGVLEDWIKVNCVAVSQ